MEINLNQNQISVIPESVAKCKQLKVLRLEENCIDMMGIPGAILSSSTISLLCLDGNVFEMRELKELPEYEKVIQSYSLGMERLNIYVLLYKTY